MTRTLLAVGLLLTLSACRDASAPVAASTGTATASAPLGAPALIDRDVLFGNPERSSVRLSPDGKYLSWVAPLDGVLNLWVAPANAPGQARAVTADKARGIRDYQWSYRPDTLLYFRDSGGNEDFHLYALDLSSGRSRDLSPYPKTLAKITALSARQPDTIVAALNDRDASWHDLYRIDLVSGERRLLRRNDERIARYLLDDDYRLRYATRASDDGGKQLLAADGDGWRTLERIAFEDTQTTDVAGLSHDGGTLYLTDSRNRDTAALYALDSGSGQRTLLLEDKRADVSDALTDPRSGKLQAAAVEYLRTQWHTLDPAINADLQRLKALGDGDTQVTTRTLDDRTWIVAYSAAETPLAYYRYDRGDGGKLTRLFGARPALEGKPLVPMWPQTIRARDGLQLVSYLSLPTDADADHDGRPERPLPLVLLVHGGPWARDSYGYDGYVQWLANRGYAVLSVNYRGSTGFGKAFTNAGNGEWAGKMHDDLLDAVQWAIAQKITSADQVAIMGGSYGGYATLVGLSFTPERFKCGVDIVGPSNLATLLGTVPPYWASFYQQLTRRMADPATAAGQHWLQQRSPLTRAAQINKPLLIAQGANDPRVKQAESDQIVAAMQARKIPVSYVLFADEGHGFKRPENSKAFTAVAEAFLGQCLGGRVQPIGDDFTGSSLSVPSGAEQIPGLTEALKNHRVTARQ